MLAAVTNLRRLLTLGPCEHPCLGSAPGATSSMQWVKGPGPFLHEDLPSSRLSENLTLSPKDSEGESLEGWQKVLWPGLVVANVASAHIPSARTLSQGFT